MDSNGSNTRTVYDPEDSISTPRFPPGVYDPSWSPDDRWIVFEKPVRDDGGAGVWHIFKIHPDGTGLIDLSKNHPPMAEYLPSFSGDGEYIVFSARYSSPGESKVQIDVFKMDKDGNFLQKLTESQAYDDMAVWIKG